MPLAIWPCAQKTSQWQRHGRYVPESNRHPGKMLPALARHAIDAYSEPGDLVIDPMCGIGTTLDPARRRELITQLERLRDLYLMGDLTKAQYVMRRQAIEEELQRAKPPTDPDLDRAQALLEDFARFWETEPDPAERRKLLNALFDHIW
jgi:hypothetical protein